jgi:hypothetical protein
MRFKYNRFATGTGIAKSFTRLTLSDGFMDGSGRRERRTRTSTPSIAT